MKKTSSITKRVLIAGALAVMAMASMGAGTGIQAKAAQTADGVKIDREHFPDANLRKYTRTYDKNSDGMLSVKEAKNIRKLAFDKYSTKRTDSDYSLRSVKNFKGIEYFTELRKINLQDVEARYLDTSKNKKLTSLVLRRNPYLSEVHCSSGSLKSLNVKQFIVSYNPNLTYLDCNRAGLTKLDVSTNAKLKLLDCGNNRLTRLEVGKLRNLESLSCHNNNISRLDVSKNTKLKYLVCDNNKLSDIDVKNNRRLLFLYCDENKLTKLDVRRNTKLTDLGCSYNNLTEIDTSRNPKLKNFSCSGNKLTQIDVTKNPRIMRLSCSYNKLTELDLRNCSELWWLVCNNNKLTKINMTGLKGIGGIYCQSNRIKTLNIKSNTYMSRLCCDKSVKVIKTKKQNVEIAHTMKKDW